jgi:hypothetical protein
MNNALSIRPLRQRLARGLASAGVMGALAVAGISTASAQSTAGAVFGRAPVGSSITVRNDNTGAGRTVKVHDDGHYLASSLPLGTYTVTLKQNGQAIAKHLNVPVIVGRSAEVDFSCQEIKCDEVANAP